MCSHDIDYRSALSTYTRNHPLDYHHHNYYSNITHKKKKEDCNLNRKLYNTDIISDTNSYTCAGGLRNDKSFSGFGYEKQEWISMTGEVERSSKQKCTSSNIDDQEPNAKLVRNSILAGSAAGVTSTLLFHPMDLLRTKMQSSVMLSSASRASYGTTGTATTSITIVSPWSTLKGTLNYGGFRALYTGLSLPLAAQAIYKSCVFTTNTLCKTALLEFKTQERHKVGIFSDSKFSKLTSWDLFLCGGVGGMVNALFFVTPVELVRNKLIAQDIKLAKENIQSISKQGLKKGKMKSSSVLRGPIDVIRHILLKHGLRGMWRGANITILRDSFGCGIYFVAYDAGKRFFTRSLGTENDNLATLFAGACAGAGFWMIAAPFDTIKTNIQTGKTHSISTAWKDIASKKSFASSIIRLYSGWQLAIGRGAPAAAVTLYTYEAWMSYLSSELY